MARIGFVSTRIAGTDGVSLETIKWASVLEEKGHQCFYFAGELDTAQDRSFLVPEAHFEHPHILSITRSVFGRRVRPHHVTESVHRLTKHLKLKLNEFINRFGIQLLVAENSLAIPMNIPLGLAIAELIAEEGIPTIAHHHDFFWERRRFLENACMDWICAAFPPALPQVEHVVINSLAQHQLAARRGLNAELIPNVLDFSKEPIVDGRGPQIRKAVGLSPTDPFILQPTRVVPRKWIERSIELVHYLGLKNPRLVITHSTGDEEGNYEERIREYAEALGVELVFMGEIVEPGFQKGSGERFTIGEVYAESDLVTYPSAYEGFGNAFLEAVYFKKPLVVNRYSTWVADIEPKGFKAIVIEGFVVRELVKQVEKVFTDPAWVEETTAHNWALASRYFSYDVLRQRLLPLVDGMVP